MTTRPSTFKDKYYNFIVRRGEAFVRDMESCIGHYSKIGDRPFFDCDTFPWIENLEANWTTIREELDRVLTRVDRIPNFQDLSEDQASLTQDNRWKTYFFYAFGLKAEKNCENCPQTTQLLQSIPGMTTAFFSILLPHKQIPEHRGLYKGVLRYHLALKVPDVDNCGIRVGEEVRQWEEGKSLLFDDTFPHAAWNDTDEIRVVLFVDVIRPMRFPWSWLNRGLIRLISISPYVRDGQQKFLEWEKRFLD
ncbi:aspartyl/asparaginyl beta-hydroxylase domain-containing protein [Baaleninema sp.]|uniref:aspartyl/asparaginyl beta-hydroxylase domain-containing protein n=1 Tax=Baaleninema sp. TaxID=3101197 RepID=UPI003D0804C7